jgi:hypothetical protein
MTSLTIKDLISTSPEYMEEIAEYNFTKALYSGDVCDYKEVLVPKRFEELNAPYKARLKAFVYTNLLGAAVNEILNKFLQGNINVVGGSDTLTIVRGLIHKNSSEIAFLQSILKELLLCEDVYILTTFKGEYVEGLVAQLEAGYVPKLQIINKEQVLIYQEGEFAKLQTVTCKTNIKGETSYVYKWFVIDNVTIDEYEYESPTEVIKKSNYGLVIDCKSINHNYGCMPLMKFCSGVEALAEQLVSKQKQYTLIENGLNAAAYAANMIQKVYTPSSEDMSVPIDDVSVGNEYLLKAAKFEFAEIQGTSLEVQMKLLEAIKADIKAIAYLGGSSFNKDISVSSGYSKSFDETNLEAYLESLGSIVKGIYTKLLNNIQSNIYDIKGEVTILGLNEFRSDNYQTLLPVMKDLITIKDSISDTAFKLFSNRVSVSLVENASADIIEAIENDISQIS